jgi:hypothetical protein
MVAAMEGVGMTHLGSFEGPSKFTTWADTVATRSLLRTRNDVIGLSEPAARQLDDVMAIGDLYHFDRFAAPDTLRADFPRHSPSPLDSA